MHLSLRRLTFASLFTATVTLAGAHGNQTARAQTVAVGIHSYFFASDPVTIPLGATVTWTNQAGINHTTTSDTGTWDSTALAPGASYSVTFTQAGSFPYHCSIHPKMMGTIVVQQAASATSTTTPVGATGTVPPTTSATMSTVTPTTVPAPADTATPLPTSRPSPSPRKSKSVSAREIRGRYVFQPSKLSIKLNTKVTWKNTTDAPHTVTSKVRGFSLNRIFKPGKSLSFVFKKVGTFKYHCTFHRGMTARVTVHK